MTRNRAGLLGVVAVAFAVAVASGRVAWGLVQPVVYYKFDEAPGATEAVDSSGNGHNGALVGDADAAWGHTGHYDGAFHPNNSVSYVEVPSAAFAGVDSEVTICLWEHDNSQPMMWTSAFYGMDASDNRVFNAHLPFGGGPLTVYWDAGNDGGSSYDRINQDINLADLLGWIHWAFVKNANTGDMEIYRNGMLWHSGTGKTRSMAGVTRFTVGYMPVPSNYSFNGLMDDFRIYAKALSAADIQDVMAGAGIPPVVSISAGGDAAEPSTDGSFTVTASPPPSTSITVDYTVGGDAAPGSDYTALPLTVIVDSSGTATITVDVMNDLAQEPSKTLTVQLEAGTGYDVAPSPDDSATIDVLDDDGPPAAFDLLTPGDSASVVFEAQPPILFTWEAAVAAATYRLVVADNAGLTSPIADQSGLTGTSYTHTSTLDDDRTYYWRVTASNLNGDTDCNTDFSFTIPLDQTPPKVVSTSPSPGEVEVDVDVIIRITFSEPVVDPATLTDPVVVTAGGGDVAGSVTCGVDDRTYVFTPADDLSEEVTHLVTVNVVVQDTNGNALDGDGDGDAEGAGVDEYTFTFTTWEALTGLASGEGCAAVGHGGSGAVAGSGTLVTAMLVVFVTLGTCRRRRPVV